MAHGADTEQQKEQTPHSAQLLIQQPTRFLYLALSFNATGGTGCNGRLDKNLKITVVEVEGIFIQVVVYTLMFMNNNAIVFKVKSRLLLLLLCD